MSPAAGPLRSGLRGRLLVLAFGLTILMASCASFRIQESNLELLVPSGRTLYVLVEARRHGPAWDALAASLGLPADLAGRVDQVLLFDSPSGGHVGFLTGDFPKGPAGLILGANGWESQPGLGTWTVYGQGGMSLALERDGVIVLGMGGRPDLEWYWSWRIEAQSKGGAARTDEVTQDAEGHARVPALVDRTAFVRMHSSLGVLNATFKELSMRLVPAGPGLALELGLEFRMDLEERKAKSAARLLFLQTFVAMGLDTEELTKGQLLWEGRKVVLTGPILSAESIAGALARLAPGPDVR